MMRNLNFYISTLLLFAVQAITCVSAANNVDWDWRSGHDYYDTSLKSQVELRHNVEKYHLKQGNKKIRENRYVPALGDFDFILRYFPNHPQALMRVSDICIKIDNINKGREYFENAIKIAPRRAPTYVLYGIFLHKIGEYEEAVKKYAKALEFEPDSAEIHYNMGLAYLEANKLSEAKEHATKAYELGFPLPGLKDKLVQRGAWK
jgi:tetratricopeptide (TPR) repeat protein